MMDANTTPEYLAQSHQVSESKRIEEHSTCDGEWFQFPVDIDLAPPKAMKAALSEPSLDWQEHIAPGGIIYYYNKKTMQSSWEKPVELMTPLERADASTEWKEFCTPDGQRYYYNKVTKQSEWHIPDELKVARELALKAANQQDQEMGKSSGSLVGSVSAEHLVHNYSNLSLVA